MKTLTLLFSLMISFSTFAADPTSTTDNPVLPSTSAAGKPAEVGSDKTLLAKPIGEACRADREKFCGDVKVGGGGVMKCMKEHEKDLSPECKAQGELLKEKMQARRKDIKEACSKELSTICKEPKGPKAKMDCLKKNAADVSQECQDAIPSFNK